MSWTPSIRRKNKVSPVSFELVVRYENSDSGEAVETTHTFGLGVSVEQIKEVLRKHINQLDRIDDVLGQLQEDVPIDTAKSVTKQAQENYHNMKPMFIEVEELVNRGIYNPQDVKIPLRKAKLKELFELAYGDPTKFEG